jgi:prepilin-type processing-associated H-X9-DG protein
MQDQSGFADATLFGSPHSGGCQFVFCDGSVHLVNYSIDGATHERLARRNDGLSGSSAPSLVDGWVSCSWLREQAHAAAPRGRGTQPMKTGPRRHSGFFTNGVRSPSQDAAG